MNLTTPPRLFAAISFLMVIAMVVGTGFSQAPFFRQSMIDREAAIVQDMVYALTIDQDVSASHLQNYTNPEARKRFDQTFKTLTNLPDTARIKVFNQDNTIIWSDDPKLVGTRLTGHPDRLASAMQGTVQAVFNPAMNKFDTSAQGQHYEGTVEVYVPIFSHATPQPETQVIGVLSLYRNPHDLNQTIQRGLYLLWAVIGGGGVILFLVLYQVFSVVYRRQQVAESELGKLTSEHERIVQIEKMSAMGELVGEIAHQLNNPLVGVINLSQLAQREINDPERVAELLAEVQKAGTECRDIVQRILRINQSSRSTLLPTNINELVQDTITFCHQSIDVQHAVDFVAPDQPVTLNVDAVLMRQALFNLIHNAILSAPGAPVQVTLTLTERGQTAGAQLSVTDTGPGFSPETAASLFKPFFTTRATGTGLGLSVAQHIAMKHGGLVLAENLPQGGARFSIWLPLEHTS